MLRPTRFKFTALATLSAGIAALSGCSTYGGQELHTDGVTQGSGEGATDGNGATDSMGDPANPGDPSNNGGSDGGGDPDPMGSGGSEDGTGGSYTWMPPTTDAEFPSDMTDLSVWRLELPIIDTDGEGVFRVEWDDLLDYEKTPYFFVKDDGTAVVFNTPTDSPTTTGSGYPRTELREMRGDRTAGWSSTSGRHVMEITERITQVPSAKPHVVAGQIHDDADDVIMVRYEGDADDKLFIEAGGDDWGVLDSDYEVGDWFTVRIEVEAGEVVVFYNDEEKVRHSVQCLDEDLAVGSYCYFKAGCYAQSSPETGDGSGQFGEVEISSLTVSHE